MNTITIISVETYEQNTFYPTLETGGEKLYQTEIRWGDGSNTITTIGRGESPEESEHNALNNIIAHFRSAILSAYEHYIARRGAGFLDIA